MAKTSEAQKRASMKWDAANRKQRNISFYPGDEAELAHLDAQPNKSEYVRSLIRADMERDPNKEARRETR